MPFDETDTESVATVTKRSQVVSIVFERIIELPVTALLPGDPAPVLEEGDVALRVLGRKVVTEGGSTREVYGAVPQA